MPQYAEGIFYCFYSFGLSSSPILLVELIYNFQNEMKVHSSHSSL